MMILSPSILSADFKNLEKDIKAVEKAGATYLHIDVMDGHFVPAISYGMPVIKSIRSCTDMVFDVHLMIENPGRYIKDFKEAGADLITVHKEVLSDDELDKIIDDIHTVGCKAGVSINPDMPVDSVFKFAEKADMILIMSVFPGFGGQKFIPESTGRVKALKDFLVAHGLNTDIQIDGGINRENLREVVEAGVNVVVAGSSVFKGDAFANAKEFLGVLQEYEGLGKN